MFEVFCNASYAKTLLERLKVPKKNLPLLSLMPVVDTFSNCCVSVAISCPESPSLVVSHFSVWFFLSTV